MRIYRTHQCDRELRRLQKNYRSTEKALEYFENLLRGDFSVPSDQVPGLRLHRNNVPLVVYKARVLVPELGGKNSGLRLVYEVLDTDGGRCAVELTLYVHQRGDSEREVRQRIADRCKEYEATVDSLWHNTTELLGD